MKKYLIISFLLLCFVLSNFFQTKNYFYNLVGNIFFSYGNYVNSNNFYSKVTNNKDLIYYNIGNIYYKKGEYDNAINYYLKIQKCFDKLCQKNYHNLGNAYYRLGEKLTNEDQINNWIKSIQYYDKSLNVFYDEQTFQNKQFVENKLKSIDNNQNYENNKDNQTNLNQNNQSKKDGENNNENNNQDNNIDQSNSNQENENKEKNEENGDGINKDTNLENDNGTDSIDNKQNQNNNQSGTNQADNNLLPGLSDYQKNMLDQYLNYLKNEELNNQKDFNKKYDGTQSDPFSIFFENNYGGNSDQKDW